MRLRRKYTLGRLNLLYSVNTKEYADQINSFFVGKTPSSLALDTVVVNR